MSMCEEQGIEYRTKIAQYTIRECILTDRMVTMMCADFEPSEILQKFLNNGYSEKLIKRTFVTIIRAGHTEKAHNVKW